MRAKLDRIWWPVTVFVIGVVAAAGVAEAVGVPAKDTATHEVRLHGAVVELTAKEFDLLTHLMRNPRKAFRREELLESVWGFCYGDTSTVTVHISRLRDKIEADPASPRYVCTVRGVGYRFDP